MATEWTFEKAMGRLEQIVAALEGGRCTLDESLKLFEEGTKLTAYCSKLLKEAEQKIVKLTAVEAGEVGEALSDRQGEDMGEELSE
ncbi:MAG: exodeoxyribonuclease VII small subunit [Clostridia bacterium]|nr:exodeoxyribonuclease VII small subunit [Clostridia bacterium]